MEDVARVHGAGHRLAGIVVLGTCGDLADAKDFVLEVQFACLQANYEPFVCLVPGAGDRRTMSATRLLARNLANGWDQVAPDVWGGAMAEDIVQPLRSDVFPEFVAWGEAVADTCPGRHPGLLPGDGSLRLQVGERTIGLVCVNTVFRMVAEDAPTALAGVAAEQLDQAVGETFTTWAEHNDITLLLAGHSGAMPELPPQVAPLLAVAGGGEGTAEGWHLPFGNGVAHMLLRIDLRADPVVADTVDGRVLPTTVRPRVSEPARVPSARRPEDAYDEKALVDDFYRYMATGQMVLVVVSGTDDGVLTTDELNQRLAEAAFGAVPHPVPALHETWAAARRQLPEQQLEEHLKALSVPSDRDGRTAYGLLRAPWSRVYDFTGSDALTAERNAGLADVVSFIDAREHFPTGKRSAQEAVAMHGWLGKDGSPQDFSDAWSVPESDARSLWFRRLRAELLTRPVAFVSSTPSSPALWETLRIAGRAVGQHDLPAFLISPEGSSAERARLEDAGLRHIRVVPADFVRRRLSTGISQLVQGRRVLTQAYTETRDGVGVVRVARLVEEAPAGSREFLIGRDPTWGDIMSKKIAPQLSLVDTIERRSRPAEGDRLPIILVKGTAGSGKTTALMQVAYRLHNKGRNAGWVDRGASLSPQEIEHQARQQGFDTIFVDDVDMFTGRAASLLRNLNANGSTLVIAAIRATREGELGAEFPAEAVSSDQLLTDDDLEKIIKALNKNALIGKLKHHFFMHQKVASLRDKCDQGLLAAMIEAVTGTSLTQKVKSEFEELKQSQRAPYAVVSFSDSSLVFQQRGIDEADLLEIVSHPDAPDWSHRAAVKELLGMKLLVRTGDGRLRCRQRTIADTVVETVLHHRKSDLEMVIAKLLLFYAGRAWHIKDNRHRDRSAMIKLLNHDTMRRLELDADAVRRIYDAAHQFLENDHHYWLQRAEYEAEQGRFDLAKNHLAAATGCPDGGEDRLVITADARVRLRSSMQTPASLQLVRAAVRAVHDLSTVTVKYRGQAPHAFVVLAREGSRWLEKCGEALTPREYEDVLDQIAEGIALGRQCCPENNQVGYAVDEYGPKVKELRRKGPGIPI
ncbi:ATP-binding protein [Streptomyces sp. NPDC013457]|uniref:ATP-binding protein n=1 Tax=Streptomyces sp. NPDC013457 TaxID=3364866 RepID=UPI0036FE33F2